MIVDYTVSRIFITLAIKRSELSIAYAFKAGLGVVLKSFISLGFFKETLILIKSVSIAMMSVGGLGLYLSQPSLQ